MEDLFKKFLYTGVGLVSMTAEKLQEAVDDLVGKGKISEKEGKRILNDFFENTETKKAEFEARLKDAADQVKEKLSFPSRSEYEALIQRVEELEGQLAAEKKKTPGKKAAAKKTTNRKKKADSDQDQG
ncbi:MAG: hypothetical protein AAF587_17865 [Bacteroidota bacterium]